MKCQNCEFSNFEEDEEDQLICSNCGLLVDKIENTNNNVKFFEKNNIFNRYKNQELKNETLIRLYMNKLQETWIEDNLQEVKVDIHENLIKYQDVYFSNVIILGSILKYASVHSIPCNLKNHRDELKISTKQLSKFFKEINAGIISEGLCDPQVSEFISNYGDSDTVRPISLLRDRGHEVTRNLSKKIWEKSIKKEKIYVHNQFETFVKIFQNYKNYEKEKEEVYIKKITEISEILEKYTTIFQQEDEIVVILISTYIVLKKLKILKSQKTYCQETRMTSVPTFSKLFKKYIKEELLQYQLNDVLSATA